MQALEGRAGGGRLESGSGARHNQHPGTSRPAPAGRCRISAERTVMQFLVAALSQEYLDLSALTNGVFGDLCIQDITPFFNDVAGAVIQGRDSVFQDGIESGDFTGWSASVP